MSIVVGIAPGHPCRPAVRLGGLLARSYGQDLVLAAVNSAAWPPSRSRVDAEYQEFLRTSAQETLDEAASHADPGLQVRRMVHGAASARRGLLEIAAEADAVRLVLGSAHRGQEGRIALGSTSTGLLQSSHLPVALAPRAYDVAEGARLDRVTAAYSGSATSAELMLGAAAVAAEAQAGIRIASFAPRPRTAAVARVGLDTEAAVVREWETLIRAHAERILGGVARFSVQPTSIEIEVGAGESWEDAIESIPWTETEVMLVGSSSIGPLALVSLGSHAAKILRHSPVPVVMVPRRAADAYAAQADPLQAP